MPPPGREETIVHRSRIGIVLIDVPDPAYQGSLAFWEAATGAEAVPADDGPYASLGRLGGSDLKLEAQRVGADTPPRLHLDVETDDVEAEVARLEALGATRHSDEDGFWQVLDPAGMVFCVVPVQTEDFAASATTWP